MKKLQEVSKMIDDICSELSGRCIIENNRRDFIQIVKYIANISCDKKYEVLAKSLV